MHSMNFVDRTDERKEITHILKEQVNGKNILLIYGDEGNGKTELIKYLSHKLNLDDKSIDVKGIIYHNTNKEYYHLEQLYDSLIKYTNHTTFIFRTFLTHLRVLVKKFLNKKFEPFLENNTINDMRIKIESFLAKSKDLKFIFFENAENIESESYNIILNLANKNRNILFIFEYTCDDREIIKIKKELPIQYTNIYKIKKIPFHELSPLLNEKGLKNKNKLKEYYLNQNGNLDSLFYKYNDMFKGSQQIFDYNMLNQTEKIILHMIALPCITLERQIIIDACLSQSNTNFELIEIESSFTTLKNSNVLIENNNQFTFLNSTLLKIVNDNSKSLECFLAYKILCDYFGSNENYYVLYDLNCLRNDLNLVVILNQLKDEIKFRYHPEKSLNQLESFINRNKPEKQNDKRFIKIIYFLIEILIYGNNYEKAAEYFKLIPYEEKKEYALTELSILSMSQSIEFKDKFEHWFAIYQNEPKTNLLINIIYVQYAMEHYSANETLKLINALLDDDMYKSYPEYYYLLRSKAEFEDIEAGIRLYEKCLQNEKVVNDIIFKCSIINFLAMNYAHLGKIDFAKNCINEIKPFINKGFREDYLLNNTAVIEMLNGNFSSDTKDKLEGAFLINNNDYERIIIGSNLLAFFTYNKDYNNANVYEQMLLKMNINSFHYEEIQHIYYQNLLYYYSTFDFEEKEIEFKIIIENFLSSLEPNSYTYQIAFNQFNKSIDKNIFYSNFQFRVDFIGYWNINLNLSDYE